MTGRSDPLKVSLQQLSLFVYKQEIALISGMIIESGGNEYPIDLYIDVLYTSYTFLSISS